VDRHQCRSLLGASRGRQGRSKHYASATAPETAQLGLYPSRYQSDEVDRNSRHGLKAASFACERLASWFAQKNLNQNVHTTFVGLAALWKTKKIATVTRAVPDRQPFPIGWFFSRQRSSVIGVAKSIDREYLL